MCTVWSVVIYRSFLSRFLFSTQFLHDEDRADISWKLRYKLAIDIAEGVAFLHALNPPLLHRDLKSPNILVCI